MSADVPSVSKRDPKPGKGRSRAPTAERRAQILEAARGCFADKGYHAATMDDLVRASGLSKGSLYWHFESKEDVFLGLFDQLEERVLAAWSEVDQPGRGVLDILRDQGLIMLGSVHSEAEFSLVWLQFLAHPRGRERMAAAYRLARQRLSILIARGVESGELRADVPDDAAAVLTGTLEGLLLQLAVEPSFDLERAYESSWVVFRGGLACRD